ncbi:hypothetical protein FRB96_002880 [Tulasnella sp. 330]|nr:hypothetical protein FRB96_002880 [Tulasnella sp. 330]KAG8884964.1 hypothetical protein FRB97_002792 [Tulasnella sp. 331]
MISTPHADEPVSDDRDFLRGFSKGNAGSDDDHDAILPAQKPSFRDESMELLFETPGTSINVSLSVDAGPGCGGVAWPAGEVLSKYLTRRGSACMTGKTCLELGSGTGLVGIVAAKLGAPRVFVTDQAPMLPLLDANVRKNGVAGKTKVLELNWGDDIPTFAAVDLILAADCVYFEPAFPLLCKTLRELQDAHPSSEILFSYKKRRKADKRFFSLLKKDFRWYEVDDDPDHLVYKRDGISLLRLARKT